MAAGPNLDGIYGSTANPVRLIYMMGTVWRASRDRDGRALEILEVGSWAGASALAWGDGLARYNGSNGRITCVDAWQPYLQATLNNSAIDDDMAKALCDGSVFEMFRHNIGYLPSGIDVQIRRGLSDEILPTLPEKTFDVVYIDGNHTYAHVRSDIVNATRLVVEGGIICGDDLEIQAHQIPHANLDEVPGRELAYDAKLDRHYHPGVARAVAEIFGPVSCWEGYWAIRRHADTWQPVSLNDMPFHLPTHMSTNALIGIKAVMMKNGIM